MNTRSTLPTEAMLTDPDAHKIVRCSWCKLYFDSVTKQYVPKPEKDCGDSICQTCMDGMMKEV